ncbi:MAG: matrixin family metalloprotease [Anaeromyxobacteraceae bacterium]
MRTASWKVLLTLLAALAAAPALAGGPLIVDAVTGKPWRYAPGTVVPVYTDMGDYSFQTDWWVDPPVNYVFSNEIGVGQVKAGFASWSGVSTSSFRAAVVGDFASIGLPDITGQNAELVIGAWNGGGIQVIFDADGTIFSEFFGVSPNVLGISTPEWGDETTSFITESWTLLNGQAMYTDDPDAAHYQGVATHEFGHAIGLAHTQTNGAAFFYGSYVGERPGPQSCPTLPYRTDVGPLDVETMYPFTNPSPYSDVGLGMAHVHTTDDQAALSDLYPGKGWPTATASITGKILGLDARTELTGVNVIARNLDDPFTDANSSLSGEWTQGQFGPDGSYTLNGLRPGARYVVYVDAVVAGGFPTQPMWFLPGSERFWDGASRKREDTKPFDPCAYQVIVPRAGAPVRADIAFELRKGAPKVIPLEYAAGPTSITGDGRTVVGNYGRGGPAFKWTEKTGIVSLGVNTTGEITSISKNGKFISTNLLDADTDTDLGTWRWDARSGWLHVDPLGSCGDFTTASFGVANDGAVYGLSYNTCTDYKGFRWSPGRGTKILPSAGLNPDGGPANGRPTQISADGTTLAGWEEEGWGGRVATVWVNGKPSRITQADGTMLNEGQSVSGDGKVVSGSTYWGLPNEGLGWRKRIDRPGIEYYESYSPDATPVDAYTMNRDGSVMAGFAGNPWFSMNPGPFLWTKAMGSIPLDDFLRRQGASMDQYVSLWSPMAMSDDGTVLAGWGIGFQWYAGWVVQMPKVFVCHLEKHERGGGHTISVDFPKGSDEHLLHGDTLGPCPDHP